MDLWAVTLKSPVHVLPLANVAEAFRTAGVEEIPSLKFHISFCQSEDISQQLSRWTVLNRDVVSDSVPLKNEDCPGMCSKIPLARNLFLPLA